jgi:hypothetical protein
MRKNIQLLFCLLFSITLLSAPCFASPGLNGNDSLKKSKPAQKVKKAKEASNSDVSELALRPILGLGTGMMSYIGNVKALNSNFQDPSTSRIGVDLGISQKLTPVTEFMLYGLYGSVAIDERSTTANWNFQSTIAGGGIHFQFEILPKQDVTPYIIVGIESFEFLSDADVYNQQGEEYYYWSDGTIRSQPQGSANAGEAKILQQNYNYNTDIRSLDLGGSGNYTQQTFCIPVGIGFMFHLNKRFDFSFSSVLHYSFTDHIDGLTPDVSGVDKGTSYHDMFLFTSVGLRFNLTKEPIRKPKKEDDYIDNSGISFDTTLIMDTITHRSDTGSYALNDTAAQQRQFLMYQDSTGEYENVIKVRDTVNFNAPIFKRVETPPAQLPAANPPAEQVAANPPANNEAATPPSEPSQPPADEGVVNASSGYVYPKDQVIYRIQLIALKSKLPDGVTFAGIDDKAELNMDEKGTFLYSTGHYTNMNDAVASLDKLKKFGYTDAMIILVKNGKRITPSETKTGNAAKLPATPPPANNENVATNSTASSAGLVFRMQFGVFKYSAPPSKGFLKVFDQFPEHTIIRDKAGLDHYIAGNFTDLKSANEALQSAKTIGAKDVVLMPFYNGVPISNTRAQQILKGK